MRETARRSVGLLAIGQPALALDLLMSIFWMATLTAMFTVVSVIGSNGDVPQAVWPGILAIAVMSYVQGWQAPASLRSSLVFGRTRRDFLHTTVLRSLVATPLPALVVTAGAVALHLNVQPERAPPPVPVFLTLWALAFALRLCATVFRLGWYHRWTPMVIGGGATLLIVQPFGIVFLDHDDAFTLDPAPSWGPVTPLTLGGFALLVAAGVYLLMRSLVFDVEP